MECSRCKFEIQKNWNFCPNCGVRFLSQENYLLPSFSGGLLGALLGVLIGGVGTFVLVQLQIHGLVDSEITPPMWTITTCLALFGAIGGYIVGALIGQRQAAKAKGETSDQPTRS